jgi:F0F1-type ATP synthase membrane subunit b/b'
VRAEAETYAKNTRAAADAFAEQRRSDAEREATEILSDARRRLANADAEIEQKMQQMAAREHERLEAVQADVEHYEERLDAILSVFRDLTSQLEGHLGKRRVEHSGQLDVSEETLKDALRPDRLGSRVS